MTETTSTLALIAIVGSVITALFKLLKDNTKATSGLQGAITSLVTETRKGNREAKQRNGHLAELVVQNGENGKAIAGAAATQIIDAVQHITKQQVDNQVVKKQEVR